MSGDGEERDVRDSLSELERRLRELERELRTASSEDAQIAAGAGGGGSPPAEPAEPAVPAPEPPAPPPVPPVPEPVAQAPETPETDPELARLAAEARRKVAALRESLDGLERASDRLRETAQTMVEDHGRTLVRLERVSATRPATGQAARPTSTARATRPSTAGVPPSRPPQQPPARTAAATPAPTPPAAPPAGGGDQPGLGGWLPWAIAGAVALGLIVLAAVLLKGCGSSAPKTTTTTADRIVVAGAVPGLGVPTAPSRSAAAAVLSVCSGDAPAAIVTIRARTAAPVPCSSAIVLADVPASADGVAVPVPRRGGGRRCVSATAAPALAKDRGDATLTRARARRIDAAEAAARRGGGSAATRTRSARAAGARAAAQFDASRRLRLLAVSARRGSRCIAPTSASLTAGTYPLGRRVRVIAARRAVTSPDVVRATAFVRTALGGPLAVDATVLAAR